jgi:hypothetical protein
LPQYLLRKKKETHEFSISKCQNTRNRWTPLKSSKESSFLVKDSISPYSAQKKKKNAQNPDLLSGVTEGSVTELGFDSPYAHHKQNVV